MQNDVVLTKAEITVIFVGLLEMQPRTADLAILNMTGATAENAADYLWDHWLGEPDEPSIEQVKETIENILNIFHAVLGGG